MSGGGKNKISPKNKMTRPLLKKKERSSENIFGDRSKFKQPYYEEIKPKRKLKIKEISARTQPYYTPPYLLNLSSRSKPLNGFVNPKVIIQISDDTKIYTPKNPMRFQGTREQLDQFIRDLVAGYYKGENFEIIEIQEINFIDMGNSRETEYKLSRMRSETPFNIHCNIFDNIIELKTTHGNCVPETMKAQYPHLEKKKLDVFSHLKNGNTEDVMEFCRLNNIRAIAYNIKNQVIAENIPSTIDRRNKTLIYLSHMNHMYLMTPKSRCLIEKPKLDYKLQRLSSDELQILFKKIIDDNIAPSDIRIRGYEITSFIHNETLFFCNPEYDVCKEVISKFTFSDKVSPFHTYTNLLNVLEQFYTQEKIESFLPISHTKPAFVYNVPKDDRPTQTIDKNKAYSSILKDLPYLLSTDIRIYAHKKLNKFINEEALYIVKPETPNILMPKQDIYSGEHVKYCMGKFEFEIQEYLSCKAHINHYNKLIPDLFQIGETIAKDIVNRGVGCFQKEIKLSESTKNIIVSEDERENYFNFEISEGKYIQCVPTKKVTNLYNRKPIAIQIKDKMNRLLFEKMEELKLTDDDIVQINTDSITFYTHSKLPVLNLSKSIDGWKSSSYKQKDHTIYDNHYEPITFFQPMTNTNTLITGPAGNGKSYYIQHMDLTNSIILSSKHSAVRQHREKGLNAHVIQKFSGISENMSQTIPAEQHIIIEECGILTREHWDFLYKCAFMGKKLTMLGDFDQLLPYDEPNTFNQPLFINMIFSTQKTMNTNWRNNFTLDYYKSLINGDKEFLAQEIMKYSTRTPEEADIIIAYRNTTVDQYNNYMLNYHNKKLGDDGIPMMCITNDLRKHEIYNNFLFMSQDIKVSLKNFRVAYARTLYNMQGDECKSYYMAKEDLKWFTNPRMAYTLISRLKTGD